MYLPPQYAQTDPVAVAGYLKQYPLGLLCVNGETAPLVAHIPFLLQGEAGEGQLLSGHIAKANPVAQRLLQWPDTEVLVVFSGPSAYISPVWYNHPNVPTYNYIAVQVRGKVHLITDQARLRELLSVQIAQFEPAGGYDLSHIPEAMMASHLPEIIGLEIAVISISAARKMSQNRDPESYANIVRQLEGSPTGEEMKMFPPTDQGITAE